MKNTNRTHVRIADPRVKELESETAKREDAEGKRLQRYLALPDLSRTATSPIAKMIHRIEELPFLQNFSITHIPEIVGTWETYDVFGFPKEHVARSSSDTYYVDKNYILRTHTTVMWYHYLKESAILEELAQRGSTGTLCYGKVYRKDEIDRHHYNVFHQIDGLYVCKRSVHEITAQDLEGILLDIAHALFGKEIVYRFNVDHYPYTDPSIEMEIEFQGKWLEVLGGGLMSPSVMRELGLDPEIYNAWAFGFGIERLAMIQMQVPDIRLFWSQDPRIIERLENIDTHYVDLSKYPSVSRDISFIAPEHFVMNDYFAAVREEAGELVEEMTLLDTFQSEKLGAGKVSYTFRIVYRSHERTLTREEVDYIQIKVREMTETVGGVLR